MNRRTITIEAPNTIELDVNQALDMVVSETSEQYIVEYLGYGTCLSHIGGNDAVDYYGEDEILSHVSDDAIEEEFYKRSPLGRVMSE